MLAAMTQAIRTQQPLPDAAEGEEIDDRLSLDNLVEALNRAVARKQATGMENTEQGT